MDTGEQLSSVAMEMFEAGSFRNEIMGKDAYLGEEIP